MKPRSFLNKKFTLLDKKSDRYFLIIFILVFGILFINLFEPFNINRWYSSSRFVSFLRLSSYGTIVALVCLFTQFPLRRLFKKDSFLIRDFILWFSIEIVLISLVYIVLYGNPLGNFVNDFIFSLKYTILGICLPYSFVILIIYYRKHRTEIESLKQKISDTSGPQLLVFKDERGKVKFSVHKSDVLYLESTDNYVSVYYFLENKVQRKLLRSTLKKQEGMLSGASIIRCHRSFMINPGQIEIIQEEGKKLSVKLKHIENPIPVSGTYAPHFKQQLSIQ